MSSLFGVAYILIDVLRCDNFTIDWLTFLVFMLLFVLVYFMYWLVCTVKHCTKVVAAHGMVLHFLNFHWLRMCWLFKALCFLVNFRQLLLILLWLTSSLWYKLLIYFFLQLYRRRISVVLETLKYLCFLLWVDIWLFTFNVEWIRLVQIF